jgi:hypothetical protein
LPRLAMPIAPPFLLAAVDPVAKLPVGRHVVELRRRLVVPGRPRPAAVDGDRGPLIGGEQHDVRVHRIDPEALIVVAARRSLERRPRAAAVFGFIRRGPCREHHIGVSGVHPDVDVETLIGAHALPGRARVI